MRFVLPAFLFLFTISTFAQPYGNEWIDYSKTHYKFQSDHHGLMQIPYEALLESGIDLTGSAFKLMSGGEEIPIYVTTAETFGMGDYIEFYATPNDGKYDTQLFEVPEHQLDDEVSLFGKVRSYYLISDDSEEHLRYEDIVNDLSNVGEPVPYFWYNSKSKTDYSYHFGTAFISLPRGYQFSSDFSEGEGWCSGIIKQVINPSTGNNVGQDFKVPTPALYENGPQGSLVEATVVGRGSYNKEILLNQNLEISVDSTPYQEDLFEAFQKRNYGFELPIDNIVTEPDWTGLPQTRINFKAWNDVIEGVGSESAFSVAKLSITYPRQFDFSEHAVFNFDLEIDTSAYFEVSNFNGGSNPILYDLTSRQRILPQLTDNLYQFTLEPIEGLSNRSFVMMHATDSTSFALVQELKPRIFTDYSNIDNQGNYLIVTNDSLRSGAIDHIERYANHRGSELGGAYQVVVAEIEDLYDQFAQGIDHHPLSIQHFVYYALDHWNSQPKYLNLLGKGIRFDKTRNSEENRKASLLPSYGYHPSDWGLVNRGPFGTLNPQLTVGRIPARTPEEIGAYLDKLIEYEALSLGEDCAVLAAPGWSKNVLYLAHGWNNSILGASLNIQSSLNPIVENSYLEMLVLDTLIGVNNSGTEPENYTSQPELPTYINEGVGIINYVGLANASTNYMLFDWQHPSAYNNEGKYPFIALTTNYIGQKLFAPTYSLESESIIQDNILAENGGAIGFLANSGSYYVDNWIVDEPGTPDLPFGYEYASDNLLSFLEVFYDNLLTENTHASIADNIKTTMLSTWGTRDETYDTMIKQYVYAGDPAVRLAALQGRDIKLTSVNVAPNADEFTVFLDIEFTGEAISGPIEIAVERVLPNGTNEGEIISIHVEELELVEGTQSITFAIPNEPYVAGANQFNISLDPSNLVNERCEYNNKETIVKYLSGVSLTNQFVFTGKVFLEGPYKNATVENEMETNLGTLIPLMQPYNIPPYSYDGTESLIEIPEGMVDWVLVEARYGTPNISGNKGTATVQRQAAILWNDGNITDAQGEPLRLYNLDKSSDFYICIRHRNHLDVLSAQSIASEAYFDFTTDIANAWGTSQQKITVDGNAVLFAADFKKDAVIQVTDFDQWFALPAALDVYAPTDANLDGVIQVSDYDLWFLNKAKVGSVEVGF